MLPICPYNKDFSTITNFKSKGGIKNLGRAEDKSQLSPSFVLYKDLF